MVKFSGGDWLKCLLILVAVIAVAMLAGCGAGKSSTASTQPVNPPTTPTPPTPTPPAPTPPTPTPPTPVPSSSCPVVTLAENAGPTNGVALFPALAPLPPPNPGATSAGSVCVSTPANNDSVTAPVHVLAFASLVNPIDHMRVYVDGVAEFFTFFNTADALIWMDPGPHSVEVIGTDKKGNDVSTSFHMNVVSPPTQTVSNIQNFPNWEPCSALYPPGHPRAGQICAAGNGNAVSTMTEGQSTPSLSGASAMFTMGGPTPYSNELYTKYFAAGSNVTHFTYDLYFMIDQPDRAQALEFDVNQTFNNTRWVFGTECNFKADGKWDVWNGAPGTGWQPTSVPCTAFPANTWVHLIWNFERVGSQVHYVSVQVNDQTYPLNLLYSSQPAWSIEDIDVAFQMDGDYAQRPYTVWLDKVNLTAF